MTTVDERQQPARVSRAWIGRAVFEAALIVLGLVGALAIDEWRDSRDRGDRVRRALASISAELEADRRAAMQAVTNHENVIRQLLAANRAGGVYEGGILGNALFSTAAWEAARDAAITNDVEHETLITLGRAYSALDAYIAERQVFLNYLYTSDDPTALRRNALKLAGWLNDMRGHAREVETQLTDASRALGQQ